MFSQPTLPTAAAYPFRTYHRVICPRRGRRCAAGEYQSLHRQRWTPFDRERILDHRTGFAAQHSGPGDVVVGGKAELLPDDAFIGLAGLALQGSLTIPVGNLRFGGKSPGGTVALPIAYDITDRVSVSLTPQGDYVPDLIDGGRHLLIGTTAGVDVVVVAGWIATGEYRVARDLDPAFHRTEHIVGLAVAFTPSKRWQVNGGVQLGVTPNSPRTEVTFGIARHLYKVFGLSNC